MFLIIITCLNHFMAIKCQHLTQIKSVVYTRNINQEWRYHARQGIGAKQCEL